MTKYAFGIDLGGTSVKIGFFSAEGDLLDKWEFPTDVSDQGRHIIPAIADSVREKLSAKRIGATDILGAGLGVPGPVNGEGKVLNAPNLGWEDFSVEEEFEKQTGFRCVAANDANVAALGEMCRGAGGNYRNLVMITLGTGVGGGIIIDGQIVRGAFGAAGEIGHMPVNSHETERCGCGKRGCLEQYASAKGIARVANLRLKDYQGDSILEIYRRITAKDIFDAARQEDPFALEMAEYLGKMLGKTCARIASVVDPEAFIFGGGVSGAGSILTDTIRRHYAQYAFCPDAEFLLATLGNEAGIHGAVRMFLDSYHTQK